MLQLSVRWVKRFDSLQTGKPIQRIMFTQPPATQASEGVSIPFKRESLSKGLYCIGDSANHFVFQFPSNGKAYPKAFVREHIAAEDATAFQFPSNGKAYPKDCRKAYPISRKKSFNSLQTGKPIQSAIQGDLNEIREIVSIPFKRESGSKGVVELPTNLLV